MSKKTKEAELEAVVEEKGDAKEKKDDGKKEGVSTSKTPSKTPATTQKTSTTTIFHQHTKDELADMAKYIQVLCCRAISGLLLNLMDILDPFPLGRIALTDVTNLVLMSIMIVHVVGARQRIVAFKSRRFSTSFNLSLMSYSRNYFSF